MNERLTREYARCKQIEAETGRDRVRVDWTLPSGAPIARYGRIERSGTVLMLYDGGVGAILIEAKTLISLTPA